MNRLRKPQSRALQTRESLLRAAELVFAKVGYERAQMEEIAAAAGYSKGGLYAHFKSKEDLFLALFQMKSEGYESQLRDRMNRSTTKQEKIDSFRRFYLDLAQDKDWALLILEVKLFMHRNPEAKEKLRPSHDHSNHSIEGAWSRLFGVSASADGEALGGIFPALVLESQLEPDVLTDKKVEEILGRVFDGLAHMGE